MAGVMRNLQIFGFRGFDWRFALPKVDTLYWDGMKG